MDTKFSIKEKVLLHLLDYPENKEKSGYSEHALFPPNVSQDGIANSVFAARGLISRVLSDLIEKGLVEEKLVRVEGKKKKGKHLFSYR